MEVNLLAIYLESVEEADFKSLVKLKIKRGTDMTTTKVSKLLGYSSAKVLNEELEERGILTNGLEGRCLSKAYRGKNYTGIKVNEILLYEGYGIKHVKESTTLTWTLEGIMFLKSQLSKDNNNKEKDERD